MLSQIGTLAANSSRISLRCSVPRLFSTSASRFEGWQHPQPRFQRKRIKEWDILNQLDSDGPERGMKTPSTSDEPSSSSRPRRRAPVQGSAKHGKADGKLDSAKHVDTPTLFVSVLPTNATASDLRAAVSEEVPMKVGVPRNANGLNNGYGFLRFETMQDAQNVLYRLQNFPVSIQGQRLNVHWQRKHGLHSPMRGRDFNLLIRNLPFDVREEEVRGALEHVQSHAHVQLVRRDDQTTMAFLNRISEEEARAILDAHRQSPIMVRYEKVDLSWANPIATDSAAPEEDQVPINTLYVGNLPSNTDVLSVETAFEKITRVIRIHRRVDSDGRPKNYVLVRLKDREEAERVLKVLRESPIFLNGCKLRVRFATDTLPPSSTPPSAAPPRPSDVLYVSNLPSVVDEAELRRVLEEAGQVQIDSIQINHDHAFVNCGSIEDATRVRDGVQQSGGGAALWGRTLTVSFARKRARQFTSRPESHQLQVYKFAGDEQHLRKAFGRFEGRIKRVQITHPSPPSDAGAQIRAPPRALFPTVIVEFDSVEAAKEARDACHRSEWAYGERLLLDFSSAWMIQQPPDRL